MTRIRLYDHPFSPAAPQEFDAPSAGAWLLSHYGKPPPGTLQVFAGEPSAATDITGNVRALLDPALPVCTVLRTPGAEVKAAFEILQIILVVFSVAQALLGRPSQMPANVNRTQASPNNSLGQRENQVRLLQRIEDIYGTVRAIPSLLMPTYSKYINHRRVEYGYYCITRGHAYVTDLRDGDTALADITGSSAAVYGPGTSPNSGDTPQLQIGDAIIDGIVTVRRSIEVDGITLKAQNQVNLPASDQYEFIADAGGDIIRQVNKRPNLNAVAEPGDEITVTVSDVPTVVGDGMIILSVDAGANTITSDTGGVWADLVVGDTVVVAGFTNPGNNGSFTVTSLPDSFTIGLSGSGRTTEATALATVTYTRGYAGTYEVLAVGDGEVVLTTSTWVSSSVAVTAAVQLSGKDYITAWTTIPTPDRTEVWVNVVAAQGMYKDNGGRSLASVDYEIQIEQLDPDDLSPTGVVETVTGTISGQVGDERAQTVEHTTAWTGPCRVRMRRTSLFDFAFEGTVIDEIKWADLYGVSPVDRLDFGDLTTVHTVTLATVRATAVRTRQLNCLASRKLPTYNGTTFSGVIGPDGLVASGTIAATSRIVDIIPAVMTDPAIGGRDIAEVDMANLWATQQLLDDLHPEAGQFNYTFDSDNFSLEETIAAIAAAAFCTAYRQSGKVRLFMDRLQASSAALFTHRNKAPKGESLSRTFANDSDFDGIEFVYVDPDTERSETIRLPLDGSATKAKRFEMPGVRSFAQAWLHAKREYAKLRGRRLAIETRCTTDARLLLPGLRVDIVDNTRYRSFDGEIVGQDGLVLRLSQRVEFTPGAPHSIVLMRRDGSLQSITCTAGADDHSVVLAELPSEPVVTEYGPDGVRTIYSFAADSDRGKQAYLITEVDPPEGGYVTVRAVNYSPAYYAADDEEIPDPESIIN